MPSTESTGMRRLRDSQDRWRTIQRQNPGVPWLLLVHKFYNTLYPKP